MAQVRPSERQNRVVALTHLRDEVVEHGCPGGDSPIFGMGQVVAPLFMIGESPRAIEVKKNKPLAGPSLTLLEATLRQLGVSFASVWLTDVVKCRTTRPHGQRLYDRPPTKKEIEQWRPILMRELEIIRPRVVVCLGSVAANAVLRKKGTVRDLRNQWFVGPYGAPVIVTYHPSYLLCKRGGSKEVETAEFVADLTQAVELIT